MEKEKYLPKANSVEDTAPDTSKSEIPKKWLDNLEEVDANRTVEDIMKSNLSSKEKIALMKKIKKKNELQKFREEYWTDEKEDKLAENQESKVTKPWTDKQLESTLKWLFSNKDDDKQSGSASMVNATLKATLLGNFLQRGFITQEQYDKKTKI